VRLMPIATDTKALVPGALATVTTTGSAGWESMLAGKPCLAFGTPWYSGCRSCHVVRSLEECRAAYAACQTSSPTQVRRDVLTYLAYVQDRLVYASNSSLFARGAGDYELFLENLATAVARMVRSRTPGAETRQPSPE
jgi:hypothetical protein